MINFNVQTCVDGDSNVIHYMCYLAQFGFGAISSCSLFL